MVHQCESEVYAHPQPDKALKHLIYVWHGHGMQFERFYSLNRQNTKSIDFHCKSFGGSMKECVFYATPKVF